MNNHSARYLVISVVAVAFVLVAVSGAMVSAQGPGETVFVTTPADEDTVSGIITVTGAVDFLDFWRYELFLKTGDQMVWAATVYAPVINGNLALLDTKAFMDGTYQIVIRLVRSDSNYTDFAGPTFTIANNLGAPLPFPEVESSYLYPPVSGAAVARIRNCSGKTLEFDYVGDTGGCSADDLWIMAKPQESPLCVSVDVLLLPCRYRGTAVGMGEERGVTYEFEAVPGKAYIIEFAGDAKLFINETDGDERASTDTGHLIDLANPDRFQTVSQLAVESKYYRCLVRLPMRPIYLLLSVLPL
jgi:hypothetical protein